MTTHLVGPAERRLSVCVHFRLCLDVLARRTAPGRALVVAVMDLLKGIALIHGSFHYHSRVILNKLGAKV